MRCVVSDHIVEKRADIVCAHIADGFGDGPCPCKGSPCDVHRHQAMIIRGIQCCADGSSVLPVAKVGVGSVALYNQAHVEAYLL